MCSCGVFIWRVFRLVYVFILYLFMRCVFIVLMACVCVHMACAFIWGVCVSAVCLYGPYVFVGVCVYVVYGSVFAGCICLCFCVHTGVYV